MKKKQLTTAFLCLLLSTLTIAKSYSQEKLKYVIKGQINNMVPVPSKLVLAVNYGNRLVTDTVEVKDGKYQFIGQVDRARPATIKSNATTSNEAIYFADYLTLLIDGGETTIISNKSLKDSQFQAASPEATKAYYDYGRPFSLMGDTLQRIMKSEDYATNTSLQEAVQLKVQSAMRRMSQQSLNLVKRNPKSHASTFLFLSLVASDPSISSITTDSLFNTLPKDQQSLIKSEYEAVLEKKKAAEDITAINIEKNKKFSAGNMSVDFVQKDESGKDVALSSFKGKYVLIDFWASWCAPCRAENPNVVRVYNKFKDKNFTVLGVSLDGEKTKDAWLKAIQDDGLNWTQVSDLKGFDNSVARTYNVSAIPQNFLIDPTGKIIATNLRGKALEDKIAAIFQ